MPSIINLMLSIESASNHQMVSIVRESWKAADRSSNQSVIWQLIHQFFGTAQEKESATFTSFERCSIR